MSLQYQCGFIHSLIHSGYFYSAPSSPPLSEPLPTQHGYCAEFHAEAPQVSVSEGLAQGPYVAARVGFEPAIAIDSTNEPPRPTRHNVQCQQNL